jgi:hypothetical protein
MRVSRGQAHRASYGRFRHRERRRLREIEAANPGLDVRYREIVIGEDLLEELGWE